MKQQKTRYATTQAAMARLQRALESGAKKEVSQVLVRGTEKDAWELDQCPLGRQRYRSDKDAPYESMLSRGVE